MKIVLIVDYGFIYGGVERVALGSALELARRGYNITILCGKGPPLPELAAEPRVRVVCLNQPDIAEDPARLNAAARGIWNRTAAEAMRAILADCDPRETIVHAHSWTHVLSAAPLAIAMRSGFEPVISLHDYFTVCPNGGLLNYQTKQPCTLTPMSTACLGTHCDSRSYAHKLYRVVRHWNQDRWGVPSRIRHFIAVSQRSLELQQRYLPDAANFYHVPNNIDLPELPRCTPERSAPVAFVGRLVPEKAPDLLAEAAQRLGMPALFIGDGPLKERIRKLHPTAEITGWLSAAEAGERLKNARAIVLPSIMHETFGLAVLEGLARGIPAIVSDATAAVDFIEQGVNGFCFRSGDVTHLTERLAELESDDRVRSLSEAAHRRYWDDPFTSARHTDRLENVYRSMLGTSSAPTNAPEIVTCG